MSTKHLLFVCVENACRSQIAEAFARHYGKGRVAVMRERGIDLSRHRSKGLADLPPVTWDAIVTMGCGDACPNVPAKHRLDWQIPDPARQPPEVYRQVRDAIDGAVKMLLEGLGVPLD
ncbi:MAG: arsenate reductase ArsC [Candidatus Omnitrophica bacterium]|nr:arsenate reductase ArsC [Candidatus Omnitrophota bacterium]